VRDAVEQSLEVVRRRLDETGMVEPMITRQGSDSILVQLPGVSDPQHIRELLGTTAAIACFTQAIAHSIVTITQIAVAAIGGNQTVQRIVAEALVVGVVEAGLKLSFYCLNWAPKLEVLPDRWWH
jgi:SecD/SecF fusion protein